jgi:hypothetical protein
MLQAYYTKWDESLGGIDGGTISPGMVLYSCFRILLTMVQLIFDVEHAYAEFFRSLGGEKDSVS